MCLVMQQLPHQPKLGLTEVIKRGSKGGAQRGFPSLSPARRKVSREDIFLPLGKIL